MLLLLLLLLGNGISTIVGDYDGLVTAHQCLPYGLINVKVAIRGLIPPQLVSFLLEHIVEHLHAKEKLLVFFLEIFLSQDLECFLVGEGLPSERVSILRDLVCNRAHQGDRSVSCGRTSVDRLQLPIRTLNVAVRVEHFLLILLRVGLLCGRLCLLRCCLLSLHHFGPEILRILLLGRECELTLHPVFSL